MAKTAALVPDLSVRHAVCGCIAKKAAARGAFKDFGAYDRSVLDPIADECLRGKWDWQRATPATKAFWSVRDELAPQVRLTQKIAVQLIRHLEIKWMYRRRAGGWRLAQKKWDVLCPICEEALFSVLAPDMSSALELVFRMKTKRHLLVYSLVFDILRCARREGLA